MHKTLYLQLLKVQKCTPFTFNHPSMFRYSSIFTALLLFVAGKQALSQNVGIGTSNPQKLFSVRGSVLIDQDNESNGTLDSAALRFGTATGIGISSNRLTTGVNPHGLNIYTSGMNRIVVTSGGFVGINVLNPEYRLQVGGSVAAINFYSDGLLTAGTGTFSGNLSIPSGYMAIGASATTSHRLRVNGNLLVNTNIGVDGNARIDGTMNIGGATSIDGKITNEGKAIMKSNSSTTLRAGFSGGNITVSLSGGESVTAKFCIPKFTGDNDNIRVMPAQFVPGSGNVNNSGCLVFLPIATTSSDAVCGGGSTTTIRITNTCSSPANSGTNATLYLFAVATD